jgi:hypothetical protein
VTLAPDLKPYTSKKRVPGKVDATGPLKVKHPYYDYGPILSHNGTYNFLVGGRGLGKTYGAKKRAIKRFLSHGEMWIYLRRYKEELVPVRETLFADIGHEFPDWDMRVNGSTLEVAPASDRDKQKRDWRTMGYLIPLSVAQKYKSVAYPQVKTIIFDEFIIERGVYHYLPNEATVFNNFYSTVDRWQDKTTVFFLANAVSLSNPYFIEYQMFPDAETEWIKAGVPVGFIVCHFPKDGAFSDSVSKTRFGQFIAGTEYEKYAVGNEFADGHQTLVGKKNPKARYQFTLETREGSFSLWEDVLAAKWYATRQHPGNPLEFTLLPGNVSETKTLLFYSTDMIGRLRAAYSEGRIWFDNAGTRNLFLDLFRRQ